MSEIRKIGVVLHVDDKGRVNMSLDVPAEGLLPGNYKGTIDAVVVSEGLRLGNRVVFKDAPLEKGKTASKDYQLRQDNIGTVVDIGTGDKAGFYVVTWDKPFRIDKQGEPDYQNRSVMLPEKYLEVVDRNEGAHNES